MKKNKRNKKWAKRQDEEQLSTEEFPALGGKTKKHSKTKTSKSASSYADLLKQPNGKSASIPSGEPTSEEELDDAMTNLTLQETIEQEASQLSAQDTRNAFEMTEEEW